MTTCLSIVIAACDDRMILILISATTTNRGKRKHTQRTKHTKRKQPSMHAMLLPSTSLRRMLQSHLHSLRLNRLVTTTSPTKYAHHSTRTGRTVDRVTDVQELCERMKEIHWKTKEGGGGDDEDDAIITGLRPFLLPASFKRHFGGDAGGGQRGRVDLLASCNTEMGMNKLLNAMEQ